MTLRESPPTERSAHPGPRVAHFYANENPKFAQSDWSVKHCPDWLELSGSDWLLKMQMRMQLRGSHMMDMIPGPPLGTLDGIGLTAGPRAGGWRLSFGLVPETLLCEKPLSHGY